MVPVKLTTIKTRDGIRLDGIAVLPKRTAKTALIWIHGLGSRFSSGQTLIHELSSALARRGIAYCKFNTRGHDLAARDARRGKTTGAAFEKFTECVPDIRAMIRFAKKLGVKKIILAGHSTGANKALYYVSKTRDRSIRGLVLAGAINDRAGLLATEKNPQKLARGLAAARRLAQKNPSALMPATYGFHSAARFISLYTKGSAEDVFPYHNPKARWKELRSIKVPIAVLFGARDEYLDRPAEKLIEIFSSHAQSTKKFFGSSIQGANHGFVKKERELTKEIIQFITTCLRDSRGG